VYTDTITNIQKYLKDDQHLLSASRDGSVQIKASVVCWHPSGETFITGSYHGDIRYWTPPDLTYWTDR
ncbi:6372_t:CDS:2, partial [Paraglomus brasilianum]